MKGIETSIKILSSPLKYTKVFYSIFFVRKHFALHTSVDLKFSSFKLTKWAKLNEETIFMNYFIYFFPDIYQISKSILHEFKNFLA